MKFELSTVAYSYNEERAERLKKLGFSFRRLTMSMRCSEERAYGKLSPNPTIEFENLQELVDFCKQWGNIVITSYIDPNGKEVNSLEIYDDYRE